MSLTAYTPEGTVATVFTGMKRDGNNLVLQQLAAGQIPLEVVITPEETLKSVGLGCSLGFLSFVLLFPFLLVRAKLSKKDPRADKA
ncbi:MAG: hypothetical protein FJ020_07255 [Chloroflexi bacterium]|nr:hypothetical protein [Chloroflexota bacterium]